MRIMEDSTANAVLKIIGLVSDLMVLLGIGGLISWSIFKRDRGRLEDGVLTILAYSVKTATTSLVNVAPSASATSPAATASSNTAPGSQPARPITHHLRIPPLPQLRPAPPRAGGRYHCAP